MKTTSKFIGAVLLLSAMVAGCSKDSRQSTQTQPNVSKPAIHAGGTSLASLGQSAFNLWTTCGTSPYNISGTNGICVPVGNCSSSVDAAQQSTGQTATGFQFNGCFKGGTSASGYSEEAVFLCDNVT